MTKTQSRSKNEKKKEWIPNTPHMLKFNILFVIVVIGVFSSQTYTKESWTSVARWRSLRWCGNNFLRSHRYRDRLAIIYLISIFDSSIVKINKLKINSIKVFDLSKNIISSYGGFLFLSVTCVIHMIGNHGNNFRIQLYVYRYGVNVLQGQHYFCSR